jgi:hypothetical protein
MEDEYEESYECLFVLAERSCTYVFILYIDYTNYVFSYIVYELH